mgnify:CR=1 FL=1
MEEIMDTDELLAYIEQNIKEDISLVDLEQVVHYSPRQIYYILKEATGMPVMSYIRYRRLINAAVEIAQGRKLIDVAVDYGFETQAGFYKAFLFQGIHRKKWNNESRKVSQRWKQEEEFILWQ